MLPEVRVQALAAVTIPPVPEIVHVVSPAMNPLPLKVTIVPKTPEPGFKISDGPVTVKVADPESPVLPVTVIM